MQLSSNVPHLSFLTRLVAQAQCSATMRPLHNRRYLSFRPKGEILTGLNHKDFSLLTLSRKYIKN
jgi:hypothetical protein